MAMLIVILVGLLLHVATVGSFYLYFKARSLDEDYDRIWLYLAIALLLVIIVFWILVALTHDKLTLAIDVIEASSDFLLENKRAVFIPVFYFFVKLLFTIFCVIIFLNIQTFGEIKGN